MTYPWVFPAPHGHRAMAPTFKRFSGTREFFVGASARGESELKAPFVDDAA